MNGSSFCPRLPLCLDAIESRCGAQEKSITDERRGGHAHIVGGELVRVKQFKFVAGAEYETEAVFVQAIDPSRGRPTVTK